MKRAFVLARRGAGKTSPNPMVGAVIAANGRIVAEGYHRRCGAAHAEAQALERAGARARDATIYVNLEPCSHHGRTPPCTEALISSGIGRVVASVRDPNPLVSGRGFRRLRAAGIEVASGLMKEDAQRLNEIYFKYTLSGVPWITLKAAVSLDGRIATRTGDSKWISSEESRRRVQVLRYRHDAVLVGVNTVIRDNPRLTLRMPGRAAWTRVILDPELQTPANARLFEVGQGCRTLFFTRRSSMGRAGPLEARGGEVLHVPARGEMLNLGAILKDLARREITSVLVEGGAKVLTSFIEEGLADSVVFFVAPKFVGRDGLPVVLFEGPGRMGSVIELAEARVSSVGRDAVIEGYLGARSRDL